MNQLPNIPEQKPWGAKAFIFVHAILIPVLAGAGTLLATLIRSGPMLAWLPLLVCGCSLIFFFELGAWQFLRDFNAYREYENEHAAAIRADKKQSDMDKIEIKRGRMFRSCLIGVATMNACSLLLVIGFYEALPRIKDFSDRLESRIEAAKETVPSPSSQLRSPAPSFLKKIGG